MVSQVNWEDDIIWTLDDVKPNLQAQARAGWIPTSTTRTAHAYALQQEQLLKQLGINKLNFCFPLSCVWEAQWHAQFSLTRVAVLRGWARYNFYSILSL